MARTRSGERHRAQSQCRRLTGVGLQAVHDLKAEQHCVSAEGVASLLAGGEHQQHRQRERGGVHQQRTHFKPTPDSVEKPLRRIARL